MSKEIQTPPTALPFARYLAPTHVPDLEPETGCMAVGVPRYARHPDFRFDLACICAPGKPGVTLDPKSRESQAAARLALQTSTTLDEGQAAALVNALSREFALIQGAFYLGFTYFFFMAHRLFLLLTH
jgi:hypothetical protein